MDPFYIYPVFLKFFSASEFSGAEQTLAGKTASHFGNFAMFWIPLRHLEILPYIQNITYYQRIHLTAADNFWTTCFRWKIMFCSFVTL